MSESNCDLLVMTQHNLKAMNYCKDVILNLFYTNGDQQ